MIRLEIGKDFCKNALDEVCTLYFSKFAVYPTTLIVSAVNVVDAYKVMVDFSIKLMIIPVPEFPMHAWMVCGSSDIVYSEGA